MTFEIRANFKRVRDLMRFFMSFFLNSIRLPYYFICNKGADLEEGFKVLSDNGVYTAYFLNTQISAFFVLRFIMVNHEIDAKKP